MRLITISFLILRLWSISKGALLKIYKIVSVRKAFHQDRHNINCYIVFKEEKAAKDALQE